MADTEAVAEFDIVKFEADQKAARIAGLRQLATFLEAHPDLPTCYIGSANAFVQDKAGLAQIARAAGVKWEKKANGDFFSLCVPFDGEISYEVNVSREQVCRKVITGTRIEPAQPERVVEEFRWECDEPLLSGLR